MASRKKPAPPPEPDGLSLEGMLDVIGALKKLLAFACEGFQVSFKTKDGSANGVIGFGARDYDSDGDEDDDS